MFGNKRMKSAIAFVAGFAVGAASLFAWAYLQLGKEAWIVPNSFSEALLERVPFEGEWLVRWGGDTFEQNAHHGVMAQHLALDLVIDASGIATPQKASNADYACWGQPMLAAHSGRVVIAVDGIPDNNPGQMNEHMVYGNSVMIQDESGFVTVYGHLKLGSVARKSGDTVKAGDEIGLCGNSGNSSEPHLHFHVQDRIGFEQGVALRPVFKRAIVNGEERTNVVAVKSNRLRN